MHPEPKLVTALKMFTVVSLVIACVLLAWYL